MSEEMKATVHLNTALGDHLEFPLEDVNYLMLPCACGRIKRVRLVVDDGAKPNKIGDEG